MLLYIFVYFITYLNTNILSVLYYDNYVFSDKSSLLSAPDEICFAQAQANYSFSFTELNKNPVEGFSAGLIDDNDIYRWEVLIIGPPDTLYEGGFFKAHLQFPKEYPLRPPRMKFITEIWHPNIDKNGDVCISILHEPGDDKWGYEKASERWLPVHTVETILISVISMLADPNDESPANVDAAVSIYVYLNIGRVTFFSFSS